MALFSQNFLRVLFGIGWLIFPVGLFFIVRDVWLYFVRGKYSEKMKWQTIEVKVPKDILKSPKAMEQIFNASHGTYSFGIKFWDKWKNGKVEDWTSFEMMGDGSGIHFFIHLNADFRNMLESAIYSEYPDAEIKEADDYTDLMPPSLPNSAYDIFGAELILGKEDVYPLRTYPYFEEQVEERRVDPISAIAEVMSQLKSDEKIWIQFILRATGESWRKKGEVISKELMGEKVQKPLSWWEETVIFFTNFLKAPIEPPVWPEKEPPSPPRMIISPGVKTVLDGIDMKTSKLGMEGIIRFVYIDSVRSFTRLNVSAIFGTFRQFNTLNLNLLKPDKETITHIRKSPIQWFRQRRLLLRKKRMYAFYRKRKIPEKFSIFNTEELATMYHFPLGVVRAPFLERLETKKGGPPAELPIE